MYIIFTHILIEFLRANLGIKKAFIKDLGLIMKEGKKGSKCEKKKNNK